MPGKMRDVSRDARTFLNKDLEEIKIKDHEAFAKFKELSNSKILNEGKFVVGSDSKTYNVAAMPPQLNRAIAHLPQPEQNMIRIKKKLYAQAQCRRNSAYRKAYGTMMKLDGTKSMTIFDQRRDDLIELFGRMFTVKEVHEVCLKDWDMKCTPHSLYTFKMRNQVIIAQKIEEHKRTYDDIRLGYKRSRLEELTFLYMKRKAIYEATRKGEDHRLLLQTLEQIRKEAEGDSFRLDGNINISLDSTIQNQISMDLQRSMLIREIIISRVAAKMKLNPVKMLTHLKTSYYADRLSRIEDIPHEEIVYPSADTYDFNKIEVLQRQAEKNKEIEDSKYEVETLSITPELEEKAMSAKEKLLLALKNRQKAVSTVKNSAFFRQAERENNLSDEKFDKDLKKDK